MTLNELKVKVLALGFEDAFDTPDSFITATERALYTIYLDRPRTSVANLTVISSGGHLVAPTFLHTGGGSEEFSLIGRAYSFRVRGEGYYTVREGEILTTHHFSLGANLLRGFIGGSAVITFYGEYDYAVFNLATFDRRFTKSEKDIAAYGDDLKLVLDFEIPDFLAPERLPTDKAGREISGAAIKDGVLYLPFDFSGDVRLEYRRKPIIPTFDDDEELIDIQGECTEMLPLLVASYIWLDDDEAKSQYYLSLYKDMLSTITRRNSRIVEPRYHTNGWA